MSRKKTSRPLPTPSAGKKEEDIIAIRYLLGKKGEERKLTLAAGHSRQTGY